MRFNPLFLLRASLLFVTSLPVISGRAINEARALAPPSQDPFYQPPAGFESTAPGTVLRSRRIVASFLTLLPAPIEAYQLLYRTTAINGSSIATVTTVFKPLIPKHDRFITYNSAYDSSSNTCSPSYAFRLGADVTSALFSTASAEFIVMQIYLLSGYIVSSPDYEGFEAAFSPGHLSGMGVLDSMRAVNNFGPTLGLAENPMVVGTGYSGGGLATAWAAALHPSYAPELNVQGWSAGGVPANLTNIFEFIDGTVVSGFEPIAIAGLLKPSAYGAELQPLFNKVITPLGRQALELANTQCTVPNLIAFPFQSALDPTFQTLGPEILNDPTLTPILQKNTLGVNKAETPSAPVLLYHGEPDEVVPYGPAAILNKAWCSYGATVKFTTYAAGGHATTVVLGFPEVLQFTADAFAESVPSGCTESTVLDDTLDPLALGVNLEPLVVGLINWLAAMGKNDSNWLNGIKNGQPI